MNNGPIEPSADIRNAAKGLRELHQALRQEGFSEDQAMILIGQVLIANARGDT